MTKSQHALGVRLHAFTVLLCPRFQLFFSSFPSPNTVSKCFANSFLNWSQVVSSSSLFSNHFWAVPSRKKYTFARQKSSSHVLYLATRSYSLSLLFGSSPASPRKMDGFLNW
ncbi:hypothetical protein AVEN_74976-1 [Araneus ventricosus]|uniref:Uncharacterized protein n=1 Tax=Araneus ventricosus TaxID=182803 RepID=A0A4Y2FY19_ARAVE|nr:hypothetical protein AVEN_74976-1 [Araneus ventricosus]